MIRHCWLLLARVHFTLGALLTRRQLGLQRARHEAAG